MLRDDDSTMQDAAVRCMETLSLGHPDYWKAIRDFSMCYTILLPWYYVIIYSCCFFVKALLSYKDISANLQPISQLVF